MVESQHHKNQDQEKDGIQYQLAGAIDDAPESVKKPGEGRSFFMGHFSAVL
jgi:hypothetical protein